MWSQEPFNPQVQQVVTSSTGHQTVEYPASGHHNLSSNKDMHTCSMDIISLQAVLLILYGNANMMFSYTFIILFQEIHVY